MFRQSARLLASKRTFSVTPKRSNIISDLYISQIKAFKPTPFTAKDAEAATKAFQLPAKPSVPESEISADSLAQYESSEVETATVSTGSTDAAVEEDWFVFEEAEEHAH